MLAVVPEKWPLFLAIVFSFMKLGCCEPVMNTQKQEYARTTDESVYMECKVTGLQTGQRVLWKFVDHDVTISSGNNVTSHSEKYEIVRAQIGTGSQSYWNLRIFDLEPSDGGSYMCMVDGTDIKVIHTLKITDKPPVKPSKALNETDCCIASGVEQCALPLCDMQSNSMNLFNILNSPGSCIEDNLFNILTCAQGGRNHVGCCTRLGVSEYCQPLCNYKVADPAHMERDYTQCIMQGVLILQCFTQGQANLPSPPAAVSAVSLGNGFFVSWSRPEENSDLVTGYKIQYKLKSDPDFKTTPQQGGLMKKFADMQVDVVYEVRVIAVTDHGASAPSYTVDVATKPAISKSKRNETIQACCRRSEDVSDQCIDFCHADALESGIDPNRGLGCFVELNAIYTCLLGADVTPCCNRTQVPTECLGLCSGNHLSTVTSDMPCMMYLPLISACAIEGGHFLPSPPLNTHIVPGSITSNSVIIQWDPPEDNSAHSYRVAWKPEKTLTNSYHTATVVSGNRHMLTNLTESTLYNVLVVSENDIGSSLPELNLLFVTEGASVGVYEPFNETACCIKKGVPDSCIQICDHTFRLSTNAMSMAIPCFPYLMQMLYCGTDERDHTHCCKQAGILDKCMFLCKLKTTDTIPLSEDLLHCILQKDALSKCFDEGKMIYPKMPTEVTVKQRNLTFLVLNWEAPTGPNITSYIVEYSTDYQKWLNLTTTQTFVKVTNLQPGTNYWLRVYSVAENFTSFPTEAVFSNTLPVPIAGNVTPDWTQVWQNRTHCCENQGLTDTCKDKCKLGVQPPEECLVDLDKIITCGADGRDHSSCCRRYPNFPDECLLYCQGQSPSSVAAQFCPPYIPVIMSCFTDGQGLLPTPPRNFRVTGYTNKNISVSWDPPSSNCNENCAYYIALWEGGNQKDMERERVNPGSTVYTFVGLKPNTRYRLVAVAMNGYGSSLPSTSVLVVSRTDPFADITVSRDPTGLVNKGSTVELRCAARSMPVRVTNVQWKRNNVVLVNNTLHRLTQVDKDDTGNYTCAVTYENNQVHTKYLWLNIIHEPVAVKMYEDSALPGDDAYLKCHFKGFPSVVFWSKDGQAVSDIKKYYVHPLKPNFDTGMTVSILQVYSVREEDYGNYRCDGQNKFGNNSITGQLTNIFPTLPPLPTVAPNTSIHDCCRKENVSDDCSSLCHYSVDIKLASSKPHCLTFLPQFIYCGADHRDHSDCCKKKGVEEICWPICRGVVPDLSKDPKVANCLGKIETILWCAEDGQRFIPTHPQKVVTKMKYDQMVVSWSPPKENAEKVDFYTIYYQSNEDDQPLVSQVGASKTSHAIGGVKKNATYQVWMVAKNDYGKSKVTDKTSLLVSSLTPRMPQSLKASLVDPVDIRVTWSRPQSSVVVTEYWVFYKQNNPQASYVSVITKETSIRLEQMLPNTQYMIYVIAHSQDGAGESSNTITIATGKPVVHVSSPAPKKGKENTVGLAVGLVLALVLLAAVSIIALILYRRMAPRKSNSNSTVAFENPHYGEPNTGVKISGLPGSSESDNQFGYTTLHEETDTEPRYSEHENGASRQSADRRDNVYDNPLSGRSEDPATLNVNQ